MLQAMPQGHSAKERFDMYRQVESHLEKMYCARSDPVKLQAACSQLWSDCKLLPIIRITVWNWAYWWHWNHAVVTTRAWQCDADATVDRSYCNIFEHLAEGWAVQASAQIPLSVSKVEVVC